MHSLHDLRRILPGSIDAPFLTDKTFRIAGKSSTAAKPLWRQTALSGITMAVLVLGILFGMIGFAMYTGGWDSPIPEHMYFRLIPDSQNINH